MSWTLVDDNGILQVRGSISSADELSELIERLQKKQEANYFKPKEQASGTRGTDAHLHTVSTGAGSGTPGGIESQDFNRKEASQVVDAQGGRGERGPDAGNRVE